MVCRNLCVSSVPGVSQSCCLLALKPARVLPPGTLSLTRESKAGDNRTLSPRACWPGGWWPLGSQTCSTVTPDMSRGTDTGAGAPGLPWVGLRSQCWESCPNVTCV